MRISFHTPEEIGHYYLQTCKALEAAALQHWINSLIMIDGEAHAKVCEKWEHTLAALERVVEDHEDKLAQLHYGGEECPPLE